MTFHHSSSQAEYFDADLGLSPQGLATGALAIHSQWLGHMSQSRRVEMLRGPSCNRLNDRHEC